MNASEQTLQQIERALRKIAAKYPSSEEATILTDIHIKVVQDSGELLAYNDDENEITRCVIEEWIDNKDENFYSEITSDIRKAIDNQKDILDNLSILKPYSFVLENEDNETVTELYVVDDDTVIIDKDLMAGLDKELDDFLKDLLK